MNSTINNYEIIIIHAASQHNVLRMSDGRKLSYEDYRTG